MKVLVVGSGGREHAIIWKLAQSSKVTKLYCAPGNAGIMELAECVAIPPEDTRGITAFARDKKMDLAVIGPEVPLAMGIVDELEAAGVPTFGPDRACSRLEASKSFTKDFLMRHRIPTAGYKEYTDKAALLSDLGLYGWPMVLKADGLAAGKGVIIAETKEEAAQAAEDMMGSRVFGNAGDKIVVEEYLTGIEASMLCFVDEHTIRPMASAQDYKRIHDQDQGPNTGGMGTYSPSLVFDQDLEARIKKEILDPTLAGFQQDNLAFKGVLFIGLMLTKDGPKVIEFNNRFGDPETQSVLMRMENDLLDILLAVRENRLAEIALQWNPQSSVCVVLAAGGYPGSYRKGDEISGLDQVDPGVVVFHAGTKRDGEGRILTAGGRVLGVTALGETHDQARQRAYENARKIQFDGVQFRRDIGIVREK